MDRPINSPIILCDCGQRAEFAGVGLCKYCYEKELNKEDEDVMQDSDVVSLARAIGELSSICNGLCARVEALEKTLKH